MAKSATVAPPVDTNGEVERASLALRRCRREIDAASLPPEWQRWIVESLMASAPLLPDEHGAS